MCRKTSQFEIKYRHNIPYSGKVWWGESSANLVNCPWFAKLKPSNLVLTINNLLPNLLIHQTFFHQMLEKYHFAKLYLRQTFLLYDKLTGCNLAASYVLSHCKWSPVTTGPPDHLWQIALLKMVLSVMLS